MKTQDFLSKKTGKQWERIGTQRRGGVATPLFSLYSKSSTGIGEFPDLKLLIDWCQKAGLSIVQLLPMNDVGFTFTPYDAQSTFALEPMYLSLESLHSVDGPLFKKEIQQLKKKYRTGQNYVDYGIKKAKLGLLWKMFKKASPSLPDAFYQFCRENQFWLVDYVLFKVIKQIQQEAGWEHWPEAFRAKESGAIQSIESDYPLEIKFHQWLQWQCYEQFSAVRSYAKKKNIFLMGDLPFLVSRDSADVWSHQNYFKLELSSGAPPDLYFAKGQRWGMPAYNWEQIASHQYDYLIEKLKYAEHFYDMYRIDHVVGVYRLWTIRMDEPQENAGLNGQFDPPDESKWEEHGRWLLSLMIDHTGMLPCGEDLGTIPECSFRVMEEFGIPGMDVQRWSKDWGKTYAFKPADMYRINSIAVVSTHDMTPLKVWWKYEAGTVDEILFQRHCEDKKLPFDQLKSELFDLKASGHGRLRWHSKIKEVSDLVNVLKLPESEAFAFIDLYLGTHAERNKLFKYLALENHIQAIEEGVLSTQEVYEILKRASETSSVFSIQLIQDWLSLDPSFKMDHWENRINVPGTLSKNNWSLVMPQSLETMLSSKILPKIREIQSSSNRV